MKMIDLDVYIQYQCRNCFQITGDNVKGLVVTSTRTTDYHMVRLRCPSCKSLWECEAIRTWNCILEKAEIKYTENRITDTQSVTKQPIAINWGVLGTLSTGTEAEDDRPSCGTIIVPKELDPLAKFMAKDKIKITDER